MLLQRELVFHFSGESMPGIFLVWCGEASYTLPTLPETPKRRTRAGKSAFFVLKSGLEPALQLARCAQRTVHKWQCADNLSKRAVIRFVVIVVLERICRSGQFGNRLAARIGLEPAESNAAPASSTVPNTGGRKGMQCASEKRLFRAAGLDRNPGL